MSFLPLDYVRVHFCLKTMNIQCIYLNFPHFVQDYQPLFHILIANQPLKMIVQYPKSNNIIYRVFCICLMCNNKLTYKRTNIMTALASNTSTVLCVVNIIQLKALQNYCSNTIRARKRNISSMCNYLLSCIFCQRRFDKFIQILMIIFLVKHNFFYL